MRALGSEPLTARCTQQRGEGRDPRRVAGTGQTASQKEEEKFWAQTRKVGTGYKWFFALGGRDQRSSRAGRKKPREGDAVV